MVVVKHLYVANRCSLYSLLKLAGALSLLHLLLRLVQSCGVSPIWSALSCGEDAPPCESVRWSDASQSGFVLVRGRGGYNHVVTFGPEHLAAGQVCCSLACCVGSGKMEADEIRPRSGRLGICTWLGLLAAHCTVGPEAAHALRFVKLKLLLLEGGRGGGEGG